MYDGCRNNVLGYSNKAVDQEVKNTISKGNLSTFNSLEEVILAEKLIKIHPWAKKVRFTRSGGEAMCSCNQNRKSSYKKR